MKIPEKVIETTEVQVSAPKINSHRLDGKGRELVDARPMEPPIGYVRRESLHDQIRRMVLQVSEEAKNAGVETIEEANDFYIDDDPESFLPPSQYEFDEDYHLEQRLEERRLEAARAAEEGRDLPPPPKPPKKGKSAPDPAQSDLEDNTD